MLFRVIQHLLPRGIAWRTRNTSTAITVGDGHVVGDVDATVGGIDEGPMLSRFLRGLADGLEPVIGFFDGIFGDAFPDTTRELAAWEAQFGIEANPDEATRRQNLDAEWAATGGQSPAYIQGILQAAGFNLFVHEWWSSGPPYVARDPHDYTIDPLIGSVQCSGLSDQPQCSALPDQPQCNRFLANNPFYIVNKNLTNAAPPPIPNDPSRYPFFVYYGAATFPNHASVPLSRKAELERLLEKLTPAEQWIVTLVDYDAGT